MPSYGHDLRGVNMTNLRSLERDGYRAPYEWTRETIEHVSAGHQEHQLSSTLRMASKALEADAHYRVQQDMNSVDSALKSKIRQTSELKRLLEATIAAVITELDALARHRAGLSDQLNRVIAKQGINDTRFQVRTDRPARERTNDTVEAQLRQQKSMLGALNERLTRSIQLLDSESSRLQGVLGDLQEDLADKSAAVDNDSALLNVPLSAVGGDLTLVSQERAMATTSRSMSSTQPHNWRKSTEDLVNQAKHFLADSMRLRKAIRLSVHDSRAAEQQLCKSLNSTMLTKLQETTLMHNELQSKLLEVSREKAKAEQQKAGLLRALEEKRGPLGQAQQRFNLRSQRPAREVVQDEVEAALSAEIRNLAAVTTKLADKVNAVDREIKNLEATERMLQANLDDKGHAINVDESCVMVDGRQVLNVPPAPSVISYASSTGSLARSSTMQLINRLEAELGSARQERLKMESTLDQIRSARSTPIGSRLGTPTLV